MSLRPPPPGWHEPARNIDGTLADSRTPQQRKAEQEKRAIKLKSDLEKYQAKSAEALEKMRKSAAGIKEEPEVHGPKDELDLVVMNLLADPAILDGQGAASIRTLTDDQRRARKRAWMDEQAERAKEHLDKTLNTDKDESGFNFSTYEDAPDAEINALLEDDDDDPLGAWDGFQLDEESEDN